MMLTGKPPANLCVQRTG